MGIVTKIRQLKPYYKLYSNWLYILYSIFKKNKNIKVKLRTGLINDIEFENIFDYTFKNYYNISNGVITLGTLKLKLKDENTDMYNGDIGAVFIKEDYKWLKAKNNVVIDIGANIGDTSIYFALNGAKKVIALEPFPYSYRMAFENTYNNGYDKKIILLNAGYGLDSEIMVEDKLTGTGDKLIPSENGVKINIFSLKAILVNYKIDSALLKMDCEGCEYNLLNEDNITLQKFKRIQIEYHYGYEKLKYKLEEAGFKCKYTKPVSGANNKNMHIVYIYGVKKSK